MTHILFQRLLNVHLFKLSRVVSLTLFFLLSAPFVASAHASDDDLNPHQTNNHTNPIDDSRHDDLPYATPLNKLRFELSGYEYIPTPKSLANLGSEQAISELLIEVIKNPDEDGAQRLRAVDMLGYYHRPDVVTFLNELAHNHIPFKISPHPRLLNGFRHRAITSLARCARADSAPLLEDLLLSEDLQIQVTVVHALGKETGSIGRQILESFVAQKVDPLVADAARAYLQ